MKSPRDAPAWERGWEAHELAQRRRPSSTGLRDRLSPPGVLIGNPPHSPVSADAGEPLQQVVTRRLP